MAAFAPGDRVHVAGLGTGIVREARNGGRYLIELKGRAMVVDGSQLEPAEPARAGRGKQPAVDARAGDSAAAPSGSSRSLDLHGTTVVEAIDALDTFLNDALLDGVADVRVIHGRSGGTLKAAVHKRLAQVPSVRGFRLDPGNPGVTLVTL
jgi:dsDNA-specific endonuclease/ATPase MutS2